MEEHLYFCYLAGVPVLGVAAQFLAFRFRLPSILLLLAFGILLGQLFHNPDDLLADLAGRPGDHSIGPRLLFPLVSLSVAVILFEGGLSLRFRELRSAGRTVFRLITLGALISWLLTALAAWWLIPGFDLEVAALLGAILVVTGPTVVAPLLRHIRPIRRVASVVKWEGIVIDPIGAILAVLVFEILAHGGKATLIGVLFLLLQTAVIGGAIGAVAAAVLVQAVKRYLIPDYLHGVVFLAVALGSFAISNLLQEESGLVTVTVLGLMLANQKSIPIHHVIEFKEHLGIFLISCLFIVLGSRLDPRVFLDLGWQGLAFLGAIIFVVRPASVLLATVGAAVAWRERVFYAFLAPRGIVAAAVTSVFALKIASLASENPSLEGLAMDAEKLVPVTFLVIVGTVAVYGLFAAPFAKALGLSDTNPQGLLIAGADPWIRAVAQLLKQEGIQVMLIDTNYTHVAAAKMDGLPAECASILSEHVQEELDLAGIGRLAAVTPNDEVNALATNEYSRVFGRANVYQLVPADEGKGCRSSVSEHLLGRPLFDNELSCDEILHRIDHGVQVKKTRLTTEFTLDDFHKRYGGTAVILFLIDASKNLTICTSDAAPTVEAGHTVIALVEPEAAHTQSSD